MRLRFNKTDSQQQLAVKLRVEPAENSGLLSWEHRRLLIHAAKTALAAALCWWLALRFGLHDGYWGSISAIIVLQSNVGSTVNASRERVLGTLIGALLGFGFSMFGALPWNYILAVLAAIIVCGLLGLRNSSRLAGVTITIIMLVHKQGSLWGLALDRVIEVVLGIVVALGRYHAGVSRSRAIEACAMDWPRSSSCWAASSRRFLKAFAEHRPRTCQRCATMCKPDCEKTINCWSTRVTSPPAARVGRKA